MKGLNKSRLGLRYKFLTIFGHLAMCVEIFSYICIIVFCEYVFKSFENEYWSHII